ncbi:hypothetical protein ACFV2S_32325 [Streptomyces sp. NPDC059695]|uniref:hypothetical protein n=1 Tax=Streptomyces sp. NPDC059695 TaxID=3346910 RepID=UPI00368FEE13
MAAEPARLPEALASFALRHLGPGAGPSVERLRAAHPDADPATLRSLVVSRGRRRVVTEGAFVGGPFLVLIPVAFCGALLSQVRTVLELAAAEGRDPADPERAAELLVLQGVYEDTASARAALETRPATPRTRPARGRTATLWDLVMRMARLLGLLTPSGEERSGRPARIGQWVLVVCVFLVGLVAPLVWLPYMAVSYNRATTRMMDRAVVFYVGSRDLRSPRRRVDPSMVAAGLRATASLLLPLVGLLVVAATDTRIGGGQWPVAGIVVVSSCLLTGGWWLWRRHRRRSEPPP